MIGFVEINDVNTHIYGADVSLELIIYTIKYAPIYVLKYTLAIPLEKYPLLFRMQFQHRLNKSLVECRNEMVDK